VSEAHEPLTEDNATSYALGKDPDESARLVRQADELGRYSAELLDEVGLKSGDDAIDLGCGPRGVLALLVERVSPGGRVVGVDSDPTHVALARRYAEQHDLPNVEVFVEDARHTGLASGSFDVVHARTLLVNVPTPETVLSEMVRLAKPGGHVVSLEPDSECGIYYPPHPALDRLTEIFHTAFRRDGADPYIGRRLSELYREAGLRDVTIRAIAPIHPLGDSRRTIRLELVRSMRPMILELGISTEAELDELDRHARVYLDDADTLVLPNLLFLARGRKAPAAR
jgi:ubiquinone/menaquinone biosynthesis C-methylase UbiE